jgi:hypothetical protein
MRPKLRPLADLNGSDELLQGCDLRFCGAASGIRTPDLRITSRFPSACAAD